MKKTNNSNKIAYISIIIIILTISHFGLVYAESTSDLQKEQGELDKKIEQTSTAIAGVKNKMTDTLSQINRLNVQINSYEDEISELSSKLAALTTEIEDKQENIEIQEKKYTEQNELLDKRMIALYESGTTSFLDMLLSSEGLADFISKYYLIEQLAEYDTELLRVIEEIRLQIQKEKEELEENKKDAEESKEALEIRTQALNRSVKDKGNLVNTLSAEEKTLEEQLEQFERDKREVQARLAAMSGGGTTVVISPSAAGYGPPLPGKSKSSITTGYYGYSGHTGVDFACSSGTSIISVKSGTVVISEAMKYANGSYRSYGEYVVVDHHDGTMTLYAHGLPGSRAVSVGQGVSQGQHIMQVGSTGNSTGPHLHFEVRIGGKPVNPTPYLP